MLASFFPALDSEVGLDTVLFSVVQMRDLRVNLHRR